MSNIKKIQDMLTGKYKNKVQVGYTPKGVSERKEGEVWQEATGRKFTIKDGKRKQITKVPPRGFDKCKKCKKLILKSFDQDTYNRMSRCYHCQMTFETKLKEKGEWEDWVREQERMRFESVMAEIKDAIREAEESKVLKMDKSVANAIGNHEQGIK